MTKIADISIRIHNPWNRSQSNKAGDWQKRIRTTKEVKLSLFADNKALHVKDPKDYNIRLVDLRTIFSKIARYKIQ